MKIIKKNLLLFLIFFAFLLRLFVVFWGYHGDLNNNISWGETASSHGLNGFYEFDSWDYSAPNQPPFYILLFVFLRKIWEAVGDISDYLNHAIGIFPSAFIWFWDRRGMILLVKLPSIISDLAIGYLMYRFLRDRNKKWAIMATGLWLFNPIVWYNSSVWGQTDAIVNLIGLASLIALLNKRLVLSSALITLSIMFKGSLLVFIPVFLLIALKQRQKAKEWAISFCTGLLVVFLTSIWFHPKYDFIVWLANLYKNRILPGEIGYLTANAFNFWWLVDHGKTYDSKVFFGLAARVWGYLISLGLIFSLLPRLKKIDEGRVFYTLALTSFITFLFLTRMHERYLYPFFLMASILLAYKRYVLPVYLTLSITHLFNLYHLFWVPNLKIWENFYLNPGFMFFLSFFQIVLFLYLYVLFFRTTFKKTSNFQSSNAASKKTKQ